MGSRKVIISEKCGQLGNQLILFSHWIAVAEEHQLVIVNPAFEDYCHMFAAFQNRGSGCFPLSCPTSALARYSFSNRIARLVRKMRLSTSFVSYEQTLGNTPDFDRSGEDAVLQNCSRFTFVLGWRFRDYPLLQKHVAVIRQVFRPNAEIEDYLSEFRKSLPTPKRPLVCCHIRRGDYRNYLDGQHFYDWDYYAAAIDAMRALFPRSKIDVVVCSDELPPEEFLRSTGAATSDGKLGHDFFLLSRADYVLGPQSTFNRMAAFLGEVPLLCLNGTYLPGSLDDFEVPSH